MHKPIASSAHEITHTHYSHTGKFIYTITQSHTHIHGKNTGNDWRRPFVPFLFFFYLHTASREIIDKTYQKPRLGNGELVLLLALPHVHIHNHTHTLRRHSFTPFFSSLDCKDCTEVYASRKVGRRRATTTATQTTRPFCFVCFFCCSTTTIDQPRAAAAAAGRLPGGCNAYRTDCIRIKSQAIAHSPRRCSQPLHRAHTHTHTHTRTNAAEPLQGFFTSSQTSSPAVAVLQTPDGFKARGSNCTNAPFRSWWMQFPFAARVRVWLLREARGHAYVQKLTSSFSTSTISSATHWAMTVQRRGGSNTHKCVSLVMSFSNCPFSLSLSLSLPH